MPADSTRWAAFGPSRRSGRRLTAAQARVGVYLFHPEEVSLRVLRQFLGRGGASLETLLAQRVAHLGPEPR